MGGAVYSFYDRDARAKSAGYHDKPREEIFTQSEVDEGMNPGGVQFRESCDSDVHPNTVPIQLFLDVTGSMGHIPHDLVKDGLPTIMGTLIETGIPDAALMFAAIGDHKCDRAPLQVGQFESGDAELDMWLTKTWLEGNGGGNGGESYLLAWYFAANHIKTDAFMKRGQKGFVITVGDEPCHRELPANAVQRIMGSSAVAEGTMSDSQLLEAARKFNHVFHIHINHGMRDCDSRWREILGENLIEIDDFRQVPKVVAKLILDNMGTTNVMEPVTAESTKTDTEEESML